MTVASYNGDVKKRMWFRNQGAACLVVGMMVSTDTDKTKVPCRATIPT